MLLRDWCLTQPLGTLGALIIVLLVAAAALAGTIAPFDPFAQSPAGRLLPPSAAHPLGTDELGRDVLSRMLYGSRVTLRIIIVVTVIAGPIGLAVGVVSGYAAAWVDTLLMRLTDVFLSMPGLLMSIAFVAVLGRGIDSAIIAIALTVWPPIARLARAETLTVRSADYIHAIELQGASSLRILVRHIVPMCIPSVIVRVTLIMSSIILAAAALGFLGLGAQPPTREWGSMLAKAQQYLIGYWWIPTFPGLAILVVSIAFNLVGDSLRDTFDPRAG